MAAGFRSPSLPLGISGGAVQAGFRSPLPVWLPGGLEGEPPEPPVVPSPSKADGSGVGGSGMGFPGQTEDDFSDKLLERQIREEDEDLVAMVAAFMRTLH